MPISKLLTIPIVIATVLTGIGCEESENQRLAQMAERHLDRQAEQNRQMSELQREVAEGSRQLVKADAKAREEIIALEREVQTERVEIGRQRDALEAERRDLASKRQTEPILAAAIANIGLLLACVLPLILCWLLLSRPIEPADDHVVAEVLLEDLMATDQPRLLSRPEMPNLGMRDEEEGTI